MTSSLSRQAFALSSLALERHWRSHLLSITNECSTLFFERCVILMRLSCSLAFNGSPVVGRNDFVIKPPSLRPQLARARTPLAFSSAIDYKYIHTLKRVWIYLCLMRFERTTFSFGGKRSIRLSYRHLLSG